ncbi:hypothetical protein [Allonocardiopsis opalescens]|uniref:Uncharacterized protein n=1 Tax=Allonocardiopsis opalescens TaxID=1144618 RepID=A0A2T0PVK9_9ACTN|nr:hypothetical protein [Allonocardiopsis opalescens]PRX95561.1 hypothetical protein CLV72_109170 [Allonocardiopsis opalescens]
MTIPGIGLTWADGGLVGLVGIGVLLVLMGWLVPRRTLNDVRADRDARIAEVQERAANYEKAWKTAEETHANLVESMRAVLETMRTVEAILTEARQQQTSSRAGDSP